LKKTHKPVRFVLSYVLSVTQQYRQRTAWKASLQSIQPLWKIQRIYLWNVPPISRYVKAIMSQFQQCRTRHSKQGIAKEVPHRSLCLVLKPFCVYRKIVALCGCEERDQRGINAAPWCKHCSSCGWWKGTSRDKATLISEEIKSLAQAVLELCLSEGISKSVSRKNALNTKFLKFHNYLMEGFRTDLKTFLGLAMPNQYS